MGQDGALLAIDFGLARVGLARVDADHEAIEPLETIPGAGARKLAGRLARLADELEVTGFVVGLPLREEGRESAALEGARRLARELERRGGGRPVLLVDESLSSREAEDEGVRLGWSRKRIERDRDQLAAVAILRRYLTEGAMSQVGGE